MIIEGITILYYTLASVSIGAVLCQKYSTEISTFLNKWFYNYDLVNSEDNEENDLNLNTLLEDEDDTYILFNEMNRMNEKDNPNESIKTEKKVVIDFE